MLGTHVPLTLPAGNETSSSSRRSSRGGPKDANRWRLPAVVTGQRQRPHSGRAIQGLLLSLSRRVPSAGLPPKARQARENGNWWSSAEADKTVAQKERKRTLQRRKAMVLTCQPDPGDKALQSDCHASAPYTRGRKSNNTLQVGKGKCGLVGSSGGAACLCAPGGLRGQR